PPRPSSSPFPYTTLFRSITLPRLGITTKFVEIGDLDQVRDAIGPKTKALFIEALPNPRVDIPDFDALAEIAKEKGIPLIVDNTADRKSTRLNSSHVKISY